MVGAKVAGASVVMALGLWAGAGCGEPRAGEARPEARAVGEGAPGQPAAAAGGQGATAGSEKRGEAIIDHEVSTLDGKPLSLKRFRGSALLIVNTASQCGYTPQYEGLQKLHERYEGRGLHVLAFPCNDFGGQEPGDAETIKRYLETTWKVTFPVFAKAKVKGASADKTPLWRTLTEETADGVRGEVKWNFTKFLVAPDGRVVKRFEPSVDPMDPAVLAAIDAVLPKP